MRTKTLTIIKAIILSVVILTTTIIPNNFIPSTTVVKAEVKEPKIINKPKTMTVGETYKLKIKNPGKKKWKWTSFDKSVATVDKNGNVTAKAAGTAYIRATRGGLFIDSKIKVISASDENEAKSRAKFNVDEAKSKITFTPIGADNTLYKVTSTYEIPTRVTVNYKIIDKDGITIRKSSTSVLATAWGDSYYELPSISDNQTIQSSYSYSKCSSISKDKYESLKNAIQICKFEDVTGGGDIIGHGNAGYFIYDIYIKNTSNKKTKGEIGLLIYDDKCETLPYQADIYVNINLDPGEIVKERITVLKKVKIVDNTLYVMSNVGDIKFYIADL